MSFKEENFVVLALSHRTKAKMQFPLPARGVIEHGNVLINSQFSSVRTNNEGERKKWKERDREGDDRAKTESRGIKSNGNEK